MPSFVRRDVSLVNVAREMDGAGAGFASTTTTREWLDPTDDENYYDDDYDDDEDDNYDNTNEQEDDGNDFNTMYNEPIDPVCRVVATSDGKIPTHPAISSLSSSSKLLLRQLELLYAAKSQKELRDLAYLLPHSGGGSGGGSTTRVAEALYYEDLTVLEGSSSEEDEPIESTSNSLMGMVSTGDNENTNAATATAADIAAEKQYQEDRLISILKQSLQNGGFKLMDQRELDLCSALNAGYLLRLSLLPDVKDLDPSIGKEFYPELFTDDDFKGDGDVIDNNAAAVDDDAKDNNPNDNSQSNTKEDKGTITNESPKELIFDGKVLIFRRGYSQETTTGRLLLPKLDYLQASIVQRSSSALTTKLGAFEQQLEEVILRSVFEVRNGVRRGINRLVVRCKKNLANFINDLGLSENKIFADMLTSGDDFLGMSLNDDDSTLDEFLSKSLESSTSAAQYNEFRIRGNKIFKLARYGVGGGYQTSNLIPSSLDLNDALTPFLLCEVGAPNGTNSIEEDMYDGIDAGEVRCQYDDTFYSSFSPSNSSAGYMNFRGGPFSSLWETTPDKIGGNFKSQYLSNSSSVKPSYMDFRGGPSSSLWEKPPAVRLLERVSIQNTVDFFTRKGRRDLVKNYFKSSTLMEPAYEEVIVIWRPLRKKKKKRPSWIKSIKSQLESPPKWIYDAAEIFEMEDRLPKPNIDKESSIKNEINDGPMPLEIKAFYDVPMANIPAVLPKTKLVLRPADAFVFDLISVASFLAFFGSLKFDSPKLDLLALVLLVSLVIRTFFRYSNKYARYDLLVNKFLTSKISHRGPGAVKYIVNEANSQRALRAMLIRDWISQRDGLRNMRNDIGNEMENDFFDAFVLEQGKSYVNDKASTNAARIDVDIPSALGDLKQLGLINQFVNAEEDTNGGIFSYEVKDDEESKETVVQLWNEIIMD